MKTTLEKLEHIFSIIKWKESFLDADAIQYLNEIKDEIERLEESEKYYREMAENEAAKDNWEETKDYPENLF